MALAGSRRSFVSASLTERLLPFGLVLYVLFLVAMQASGRVSVARAIGLLFVPVIAWITTLRPAALILAYAAMPPGVMTGIAGLNVSSIALVFLIVTVALIATRGRVYGGMILTLLPLAILIIGAFVTLSTFEPRAYSAASEFRRTLILYAALFAASYIVARTGEMSIHALGSALMVSAGISGLIFLWQTGFQPWTYGSGRSDLEPGLLFYRTHFGYMMALGFGVALSRFLSLSRDRSLLDSAALGFFSLLVVFSFTRGAWLIAVILVAMIPIRTGNRLVWLLLPIFGLIATGVPLIQERLFSDISGGLQRSLESGNFATGRWGLWQLLWDRAMDGLPLGQGFGYVWDLSPAALFGSESFTTENNPFVYVHNDFLYWLIELGVIGFGALVVLWATLVRTIRFIGRLASPFERPGLIFGGVVLTMFVASFVDNGLFIRPVAERFFIVAGAAWALLHRGETLTSSDV